jgi:predicted ATPase
MLTELRVKNVRVFSDRTWSFPLRPLTVFCGTNSAGKSTLLKILPLLRQTQAARDSNKTPVARLRFVGSQVDFGNFNCFASAEQRTQEVEIGVTIRSPIDESFLSVFPAVQNEIEQRASIDHAHPHADYHYELKADFCFDTSFSTEATSTPADDGDSYSAERDPHSLRAAHYSLHIGGHEVLRWKVYRAPPDTPGNPTGRPERTQYLLDIPTSYFKDVGGPRLMTPLTSDTHTTTLPVMLRGLLPQTIVTKWAHNTDNALDNEVEDDSEREEWGVFPIPPHIEEATRDLSFTLTNTRYVGPLRAPARRYYLTRFDGGNESDPTGDFLPYILRDLSSLSPVVNRRILSATEEEPESLNDALNYWLHFLRTGNRAPKHEPLTEVEALQTKSVLVEIKLVGPRSTLAHSIADSGFGYSQVLPILVSVLLSSPDDTILIEQPELHLNPALQVRIAEFFAAMAQTGRQIILETHSEHIVNALRVLVAEDTSTALASLCHIYYIDAESGPPCVRSLEIEPNGNVPDWPVSFFGEAASLTGRLLRAQKRFRKSPLGGH